MLADVRAGCENSPLIPRTLFLEIPSQPCTRVSKMAPDSETRRLRAKQVGMLMQAYRRAHRVDGRTGRLTQDGLLRLMAQVHPLYSERYDHSTVVRWESGATRPTKERLEVFGKALDLSPAEVDGLLWLAGLHNEQNPDAFPELADPVEAAAEGKGEREAEVAVGGAPSFVGEASRYFLTRFVLPGLLVAGTGSALAYLGWNAAWMMMLYVVVATGLVLVQGFLRLRRSNELRELLFISVFFLLCANLLQVPIVRMDPYGFYAIGDWAGTPIPYLLALLANLMLALAAGLIFDFLWRWQYSGDRGSEGICRRAAWTSFPPLILVYACSLVMSGLGTWIYLLFVFSILGGTFMALLILRDDNITVQGWERKLMLQAGMAAAIVLTAAGGAAILVIYIKPSMMVIPDHTLIHSWEIDFDALGYSAVELMDRYRIGAVWSSLAALVYMVIVLGGNLIVGIYRLDDSKPDQRQNPEPDSAPAAAAVASSKRRRSRRSRLDFRQWPGWLSGSIISPSPAGAGRAHENG